MLLALCLVATPSAQACTIPVFRYALDRWSADHFSLDVPESLRTKLDSILGPLQNHRSINIRINPSLGEEAGGKCRLVAPANREAPVWSGELTEANLKLLTESPGRTEILKRIVAGESGVWVMVESGDKTKDDTAAEKLMKRLKYLNSVATIPPQDPFDPESQLGPGPKLRVEFSLLRLKSSDPAELPFLRMLAGPKSAELVGGKESYVAPVFGRGRVLGVWKTSEVLDEDVDDLCLFLLGACSCQVKQQNPGWDLLMAADWDAELMKAQERMEAEKDPEALPKLEEITVPQPEVVKISGKKSPATNSPTSETNARANIAAAPETAPAANAAPVVSSRKWMIIGSVVLLILGGLFMWPTRPN